jgi:hypothetical protein
MINEIKEVMNKHLSEFQENTNKQVSEIRGPMQDIKEDYNNKDIKILKN